MEEFKVQYKTIEEQIEKIFKPSEDDVEVSFNEEWIVQKTLGGIILYEDEWDELAHLVKEIDDTHIFIVERSLKVSDLVFKIPVDTQWDSLVNNSTDRSSYDVLHWPNRIYYIFSNNSKWGIYINNDDPNPFQYTAFDPQLKEKFMPYIDLLDKINE